MSIVEKVHDEDKNKSCCECGLTLDRLHNIGIPDFAKWANKTLPASIPGIISNYSSGVVEFILLWIYVILMGIFLYYTVYRLIKKK